MGEVGSVFCEGSTYKGRHSLGVAHIMIRVDLGWFSNPCPAPSRISYLDSESADSSAAAAAVFYY